MICRTDRLIQMTTEQYKKTIKINSKINIGLPLLNFKHESLCNGSFILAKIFCLREKECHVCLWLQKMKSFVAHILTCFVPIINFVL